MMEFYVPIVILLACTDVMDAMALDADLMTLSQILPGIYTNSRQHVTENGKILHPARGHMLMKTIIRPVDVHFMSNSFNVFVEQYTGTKDSPYRQRLQSFSVDQSQRAIRMRVFTFVNSSMVPHLSRDLSLFKNLTPSAVVTQKGCDMFWRRLKKRTFVGSTGRGCEGSIRREPVRISVSTTLTSKILSTHEGWYRIKDGSKVMEAEMPYNLVKIKRFGGLRQTSKTAPKRTSRHLNVLQNDIPNDKPYRRGKSKSKNLEKRKASSYISSIPTRNSAWTLRTFRSLADTLTSGRAVYFNMELSGCLLPQQSKIERTAFGDSIDVFDHVIHRRGRKREYIKFTLKKFQQTSRGYEMAVRQITVFRNGKVIVRLHMNKADRVPLSYAASCRLYDYDVGSGDIKFSTDPFKNIRRIKSFGFLRSSLKKGRKVRMSVDFSKCSGSDPLKEIETGGEVRGYDFINSGKGIEFYMVRPEIGRSRDGFAQRFLIGRVFQNGDVIFTDIADESSNSLNQAERHYRCSLKGDKTADKPGEKSVKFYYL